MLNQTNTTARRVGVIGSGYVGLTSAACLSHLGHDVIAVDNDIDKIESLRSGVIPIYEPGLDRLVIDGQGAQRLRFTENYGDLADREVVLLCLPTPRRDDGVPDMSYLEDACHQLIDVLPPGTVVVTKSTVPIGAHRDVRKWLVRDDLLVASNPEFLREGSAIYDFLHPDRVVIGASDPDAANLVLSLYAALDTSVQITDTTSAELIKYASNSFLATKLSFINEMSRLCEITGADIDAVAIGMGSDQRIGNDFLRPGPGWGGSCFPKDTLGLASVAAEVGLDLAVTNATVRSNRQQIDVVFDRIVSLLKDPIGDSHIGVWGVTFKANTDDVRDSPAVEIINRLVDAGAQVTTFDPAAPSTATDAIWVDDPYTAVRGAHLLVVLTEWEDFATADFTKVAEVIACPIIFDTREVIDHRSAAAQGFTVHRIGRPTVLPGR